MEDQTKNQMGGKCPEGCTCPMCQGKMCGMGGCCSGRGCWYRAIRWIIGIAIILIVFCFGMMIGELKGEFGRGYRMMHAPYYGGGSAYPMMQNWQSGAAGQSQTAPATPSK